MPKKTSQPHRGPARPKNPAASSQPPTAKPRPDAAVTSDASNSEEQRQTRKRQQLVLDVFRTTLSDTLAAPDFQATLQAVKKALFERDFDAAFNTESHLLAYAARWSPTRALCYLAVLEKIKPYLDGIVVPAPDTHGGGEAAADQSKVLRLVTVGGAAAETVAFGAFVSQNLDASTRGEITLVDIAPWAEVVRLLHRGLVSAPPVSKYASAAAKEAAVAMIRPVERFVSTFTQRDILAVEKDDLAAMLCHQEHGSPGPVLVMINFTLNELFTAGGIGRTTTFLLRLSAVIPRGSLLLVLDSPGSYSETAVGGAQADEGAKEKKKYPMQWLLHKVLLSAEDVAWTRLETDDSVWFRLPDNLDYPIPLENMRYQMHLYRVDTPTAKQGV